jgi:high-affinity nickel-transport protein
LSSLLSLLAVGFFLGVRHATDADHVVAIATIVTRERRLSAAAAIGVLWGVGHGLTVAVVGCAIILFGVVIPPRVGLAMEFAVGIMLVILGVFTLAAVARQAREALALHLLHGQDAGAHGANAGGQAPQAHGTPDQEHGHSHVHMHGDYVHSHEHGHSHGGHGHSEHSTPQAWLDRHFGRLTLYQALRPVIVGVVHGLAGSAAVGLLALAAVRDPFWGLVYLFVFGFCGRAQSGVRAVPHVSDRCGGRTVLGHAMTCQTLRMNRKKGRIAKQRPEPVDRRALKP